MRRRNSKALSMFRAKVEKVLKEFDDFKPGDIVRLDLWFGRVLEHIQPDMYKVSVSTPDGIQTKTISKDQMQPSYPMEFISNWNGCGGNTTDLLTDEEWIDVKANHPQIYEDCLKRVASNTNYGNLLEDWIFEFLMSDKNQKQGKPGTVIDAVKNADFGPIMKYMNPGEQLHDAIIRLWKEALYVSEDKRNVFMSY